MSTKILVIALASDLDLLGELSSVLGPAYEVTLIRGADRQKLEMALDGRTQFDVVHIQAHGGESKLSAADGLVSEAEIVTLIESQTKLRFVIVASCDSYEIAGGIHNVLHIPCIGYNAPIDDKAAVEFSRAFYRTWQRSGGRRSGDIHAAVARARESLAVLYPSEARKVRIINGDMVTPTAFNTGMVEVRDALASIDTRMTGIETRLERIEAVPERWLVIGIVLAIVLIIAQIATPFIASALRAVGK
jgi:hypothetical protein